VSVASSGGGEHPGTPCNDALDPLSGLRMFDQGSVFNALLDLVSLRYFAFFGGDRLVNVGRHIEVMSDRLAVTRKFVAEPLSSVEFTCKVLNVAAQGFRAISLLPGS
jgi:hypothetical protein